MIHPIVLSRHHKYDYLMEIPWEKFDQCPQCYSKKVNEIRSDFYDPDIKIKSSSKNIYCVNCGCEWLKRSGKTYMIDWKFID